MKNYNINSLYICLLIFIYNVYKYNYSFINDIFNKICLLNYTSLFIIINLIGLHLLLTKISFEVNVKCSLKYN